MRIKIFYVDKRGKTYLGTSTNLHLIDEEDDFTLGLGNLLQNRLETLLELAAHGGTRHKGTEVQTDESAGRFHAIRDVSVYHALSYTLGNGLSKVVKAVSDGKVRVRMGILLC